MRCKQHEPILGVAVKSTLAISVSVAKGPNTCLVNRPENISADTDECVHVRPSAAQRLPLNGAQLGSEETERSSGVGYVVGPRAVFGTGRVKGGRGGGGGTKREQRGKKAARETGVKES